jgi:hypothetical protein
VILASTLAAPAAAVTARDLSSRIQIDGSTNDFSPDERIFGIVAATGVPEEADDDSQWGPNNDVNQIRITWDAQNLYIAGEGKTWNNNLVILVDVIPTRNPDGSASNFGLTSMIELNSWRRNFEFDTSGTSAGEEFMPDLFGATWDGNTAPRLIVHRGGSSVDDEQVGEHFRAVSTFLQDQPGRCMEFAIPWRSVFLAQTGGPGVKDTVMTVAGQRDTFRLFPPGTRLKICAVVTAGGDGTGGPDSAPDNTRGHTVNGQDLVFIDNYAIVDLDRVDDTGRGRGGPDGVADWNVEPRSRVTFRYPPPIKGVRFEIADLALTRRAFAPDHGDRLGWSIRVEPPLDPTLPIDRIRKVSITANVFDLRGRFVRNVLLGRERLGLDPNDPATDVWDGRDEKGNLVPPGVYVLRVVIEPNLSRATRSFVVVR